MKTAGKLLTAFAAVGALSGCGVYEYSNGFRDGEVTKFSSKGVVFKTNEGALSMSNLSRSGAVGGSNNGTVSNSFDFSVRDAEVAKQISELAPGTQVRLHYKQVLFPAPWLQETEYLITKVTVANAAENKKEVPLVVPAQPATPVVKR